MKPTLTLKSLADIPASTLSLVASMPARAMNVSRQVLDPAVRATRHEVRAARDSSAEFARDICAGSSAPFPSIPPWQRGGLNE